MGLSIVLAISIGLHSPTQAQSRDTSFQAFTDDFDSYNPTLWHLADGWANGDPFDCGWEATSVFVNGGVMSLQINDLDCPCSGRPYASGEYRSNGHYQYGTYTVRMKAVDYDGVVSSFFIYTGPSEGNPWDEIDIEIIGKDTTKLQTNYYTNGVGGHEGYINLGFDAAADFHTYSIEWMPDSIKWYVDGELKLTENGSHGALPTTPGRIMMNFWPGTDSVNGWLGDFVYTGPLVAQYDSVSFEPLELLYRSYLPLTVQ
jgi:beta-glucanase (GH16 family)